MEDNTVLTGNKLIAEFMGAKLNCESGLEVNFHMNEFGYKIGNGNETFNSLKFHKSWDWLVPVIDKIYSLDIYSVYVSTTSGQFENAIYINTRFIENTYEQVIEFIKWYNENKEL